MSTGQVLIIGAGLIGTSVGLALRARGVDVVLSDISPTVVALARDMGAGQPTGEDSAAACVDLVVVATPPDVTAAVTRQALLDHPSAVVTDVASVKAPVVTALAASPGAARFVGGHPMAGRERSGPLAARGDLFEGRPWVLTPTGATAGSSLQRVRRLVTDLGAAVIEITPAEHDEAVAVTSHLPQLAASLVAGRLLDLGEPAAALSGQGLRDVTRLAGSDPMLWAQILTANADPVRRALRAVRGDIDEVLAALDLLADSAGDHPGDDTGARAVLARVIADGNEGRVLLPGKHGTSPTAFATVGVMVPDRPGEIARLLTEVDLAGVNLEDIRIEHSLGRPTGLVEILVHPSAHDALSVSLRDRAWVVV